MRRFAPIAALLLVCAPAVLHAQVLPELLALPREEILGGDFNAMLERRKVRHPGQAIPLAGSWFGDAGDYLGMSLNVAVHKIGEVNDPSEG